MKVISTKKAPAAIGPYSQAIQVGNLVYTSGQIPIDPATGAFVEGGINEQTRQSLTNVKAILEEAGLSMSNVVKTTVFMADMNDFADMNAVYAEFFTEPYPARSASVCLAIFLLGYPDSNQERQDQNLQCYHYTIPQFRCKEKPFSRLRVQR